MPQPNDAYKAYLASIERAPPSLGAAAPIGAIVKRLRERLAQPEPKSSYVVGLYGEWGCGKTFWLEAIRQQMVADQKDDQPLVIPVLFNAWRFEKEPHLIVPLVKTAANELRLWATFDIDADWKQWLLDAGKKLGVSAAALAYSFAEDLSEGVLGDAIKTVLGSNVLGTLKKAKAVEADLQDRVRSGLEQTLAGTEALESLYFDFHRQFEDLLRQKSPKGRSLRLLFLIDDLDRCLPEKAVEMLESIKLFLDVEGTAYVVAVDDEVVERGIAHRYRDYRSLPNSPDENHRHSASSPISGHEYLEKIITLPVRIDRPNPDRLQSFIEKYCVPLWELQTADAGQDKPAAPTRKKDRNEPPVEPADPQTPATDNFQRVLRAIPPNPRKLLRLSESFALRREVLANDRIEPLLLLRIVAIQLFAPDIYRLAQKRLPNLFGRLREWQTDETFGRCWPDAVAVLKKRQEDEEKGNINEGPEARKTWELVNKPLLRALAEVQHHRAGFDPCDWLDADWQFPDSTPWRLYFGEPQTLTSARVKKPLSASKEPESKKLESREPDIWWQEVEPEGSELDELLRNLLTNSESEWQSATSRFEFGQKLGPRAAGKLLDQLRENLPSFEQKDLYQWLEANCRILTPDSIRQFIDRAGLDKKWRDETALQELLTSDEPAVQRARAGRILAHLGDNRPGLGLDADGLPEHRFVPVPVEGSAGFYPGFRDKAEAEQKAGALFDEFPPDKDEIWDGNPVNCEEALPAFAISAHTVTVRQFQVFMERVPQWLNQQAPWLADNKKPVKEIEQLLLSAEWCSNTNFCDPNQPVVNINWYQASAYCDWLSGHLGQQLQLPTEREWEWLARRAGTDEINAVGTEKDRWFPFGNRKPDPELLANFADNGIDRTAAVGLYPFGALQLPEGHRYDLVYELAGNALEWCATEWCEPYTADWRDRPTKDWWQVEPKSGWVVRGGSWISDPAYLRSAIRIRNFPVGRNDFVLGFRLARTL